jgi:outer membrane protein assembly factor BamB
VLDPLTGALRFEHPIPQRPAMVIDECTLFLWWPPRLLGLDLVTGREVVSTSFEGNGPGSFAFGSAAEPRALSWRSQFAGHHVFHPGLLRQDRRLILLPDLGEADPGEPRRAASAAVRGRTLLLGFEDLPAAAIDIETGSVLWATADSRYVAASLDSEGLAVLGDRLYCAEFDAAGHQRWRTPGTLRAVHRGAIVIIAGPALSTWMVYLIDRATGRLSGDILRDRQFNYYPAVALTPDVLYVTCGSFLSGPDFIDPECPAELRAFTLSGQELWRVPSPKDAKSVATLDGRVYVLGSDGSVACFAG